MTIDKLIGQNMRAFRKQKGLTTENLASATFKYASEISLIERGKRATHTGDLVMIAKVLGRGIEEFIIDNTGEVKK